MLYNGDVTETSAGKCSTRRETTLEVSAKVQVYFGRGSLLKQQTVVPDKANTTEVPAV
jgi:hypothetical protein